MYHDLLSPWMIDERLARADQRHGDIHLATLRAERPLDRSTRFKSVIDRGRGRLAALTVVARPAATPDCWAA